MANKKLDEKPIVIVGCGFAGSSVLMHTLLKIAADETLTKPVKIVMLERKPKQLHAGLAYGKEPEYRKNNLNIGSKRVNPFPAGKNPPGFPTFVQYIQELSDKNPEMKACLTNPPRQLFGDYVHHMVGLAIEKAGAKAQVETLYKNVTGLEETATGTKVSCSDGTKINASHVVLATGFQDALAPKFARGVASSPRFLETPYSAKANNFFDKVCDDKKATALIIGTGLTAMDTAVRLINSGFKGSITMMSRRALMHKPYEPTPVQEYVEKKLRGEPRPEGDMPFTKEQPKFMRARTVPGLVRSAISEFRELTKQGYTSEEIIGYWERFVPAMSQKFPKADLAGLLAANDVLITTARVGVTPDVGATIQKALESGQVKISSGTIHDVQQRGNKMMCAFTPGDGTVTLSLKTQFNAQAPRKQYAEHDYIFSAMGNSVTYDPKNTDILDPLWKGLMDSGKATPHWTKMGITVTNDFSLMDKAGAASANISVIGVPVAGHMMVSSYPYPEKPGAGGRLGPTAMNVAGITGATLAFLDQKYDKLTANFHKAPTAGARAMHGIAKALCAIHIM
ncbi:MAG: FAD/NAD(P)-binding protein [Micavibrio sp.]|nr:FAD/NAD(P)-binding protein [Micavibrio sp.]